jgi:hypothetical protein
MERLRNSLEIALYCSAHNEGKAGLPSRANEFGGRDKLIFEAGHQDGKAAAFRASFLRITTESLQLAKMETLDREPAMRHA